MDWLDLTALFSAAAVNAALPGPCTILTISTSVAAGRNGGVRVSIGILLANLVLVAAALAIIGGILSITPEMFRVLKWVGALLLLAIALRILSVEGRPCGDGRRAPTGRRSHVANGLMAGISSPFNLAFMIALLPQFLPERTDLADGLTVTLSILAAVAVAQSAVVTLGLGATRIVGAATPWLERTAACGLVGVAGASCLAPVA